MHSDCSTLVRASLDGDLSAVQSLVEAGADLNGADEHGIGPLLCFTPAVMQYLLAQGADPNRQTNESGAPVLVGVAYMRNAECVRLLLEAGVDPHAAAPFTGETALHACLTKPCEGAEASERHKLVETLLKYGANPNCRTASGAPTLAFWRDVRTRGETPLHRAAAYAAKETIELLLAAGADKTIRDANGDSPQSWASWHWRPREIIDLLNPQN